MDYKKKLHTYYPKEKEEKVKIETYRTKEKIQKEDCDPKSIERGVRQLLANKISGNLAGIWLLIPEHLRLGSWQLLKSWSGAADEMVETRLAMQLVNESALCVRGIRQRRTLSQRGFEVANGLPFIATDTAIHNILDKHTVGEAQMLQIALGKIRETFGHFNGRILAIDAHRLKSYSKRQMPRRKKERTDPKPSKVAQTFFCLDTQTKQPICFTTASSARTVTQATPELLTMVADILKFDGASPLVMADNEYYTAELFDWVYSKSPFDMLVPMTNNKATRNKILEIPADSFKQHWAGYATAKSLHQLETNRYGGSPQRKRDYFQLIERKGERQGDYTFRSFLSTADRNEIEDLSINYPKRWHIEEFFKNYQALGWNRAGTMNLNIRYGKMTMALLAQATTYMMRQRIGMPFDTWDAQHFANDFFRGLEGDIRVSGDTIIVTYYNAPNVLHIKGQYENLPKRLSAEGISPNIPWLYNLKLDFRFK
jgi:hypothetical protein